jgi:probable H4MPT-linked C1 transfer pathway protein
VINILGWDIGAANIKAAWVMIEKGQVTKVRSASQPFEIWREKDRLSEVLRAVFSTVTSGTPIPAMAVTMTAELSDIFATKREGVRYVLENVHACFPDVTIYVLSLAGEFVPLSSAYAHLQDFAATNWLASAQWIRRQFSNGLLVDVGSTTSDILPVLDGQVNVCGRTDLARLSSGELVFTGILRTNLAAIVSSVPIAGRLCRVASEYFAISGDVHLILGHLRAQDYCCSTPDGQPPTIDSARRRLARLVCADTEMLSAAEIDELARYIFDQQICRICDGMNQVISRLPRLRSHPAIVLGSGAFLGAAAARRMGMEVRDLAENWGREALAVAPCLAVAHLLAEYLEGDVR